YPVKQGTCNGTYYTDGCGWDGWGTAGSNEYCRYSYYDQASCNSAPYGEGCSWRWGSIPQTCYASTQTECNALGGCSWKSYPDDYRSCTAASYESACTGAGAGAGYCTWGPR